MKAYDIFLDDNDQLNISVDGEIYIGEECNDILKEINELEIKESRATNRTVYFESDDSQITIHDIKDIQKSKVFEQIPKLFEKFNKSIMEYYNKENKKLSKNNIKKKFILASTTSLVLILLSSAVSHKFINNNFDEKIETVNDFDENLDMNEIDELDYEEAVNSIKMKESQSQSYFDRQLVDGSINGVADIAKVEYVSEVDTVKKLYDEYYGDIEEIATRWGLDPQMMMCILIHESDGRYQNLMQIHFRYIENMKINLYDFEQEKMRTIIFTNNPNEYYGLDVTCITEEEMKNRKTNISAACILFRYNLKRLNNHIGAAIQCYNLGYKRMMKLLNVTAENTGLSVEEMLEDQSNVDFIKYANTIDLGDPNYVRNVVKFSYNPSYTIRFVSDEGEIYSETVEFQNEQQMKR